MSSPSPSPSPSATQLPLSDRPAVFSTLEQSLQSHGIGFSVSWVQYAQAMPVGTGENNLQYGGKLIAKIAIDGAKIGLWNGFSMSIIPEYNYGHNVNGDGGTIFPVNTALKFPQDQGEGGDVSRLRNRSDEARRLPSGSST